MLLRDSMETPTKPFHMCDFFKTIKECKCLIFKKSDFTTLVIAVFLSESIYIKLYSSLSI